MNWRASPQRAGPVVRETPQSVHGVRFAGAAVVNCDSGKTPCAAECFPMVTAVMPLLCSVDGTFESFAGVVPSKSVRSGPARPVASIRCIFLRFNRAVN